MDKSIFDPEVTLFTLSDVKLLYISIKGRLFKWGGIGCVLAFLGFGIITPKYKIEATFKENTEQSAGLSEGVLKEILSGSGSGQPQASSLMKSFQVLKPLVEKTGLQIGHKNPGWIVGKVLKRYRDNLNAEKGIPLTEMGLFSFQDVKYEGEGSIPFTIRFIDANQFAVYSSDKKTLLCDGIVGAPVSFEGGLVHFTLKQTPKDLRTGFFYSFTASPWVEAARGLRAGLRIISDTNNKSIYNVAFGTRDRDVGTLIINELMNQYQLYLKREYDQFAKHQLVYLENKQSQICEKLDGLLSEQVEYYRRNLSESGFGGSEDEGKGLLGFYHLMHGKILAIDTALSRMNQIEKNSPAVFAIAEEGPFSEGLNDVVKEIRNLRQQKDLLESSLSFSNQKLRKSSFEDSLQDKREELREIRHQRFAVEAILDNISSGKEIASFDLRGGPCLWAGALRNVEEREDLANYLGNYKHLLSVREKILQESSLYEKNRSLELEGIDLETARILFVEYNRRLDESESSMCRYAQYKKEIESPGFELASLSSILNDATSQKLISQASALSLQLKDEKHRSSKESTRWEEDVALYKKVLAGHLDQLYKVEVLNTSFLREKMLDLQKISLDCINRQISVLNEQTENSIEDYRQNLIQERKLLEKRMEEIRASTANLPEKWRLEKWLDIKTDLVGRIMRTVTEVAESKTIASHLHRVASKPLDYAITPMLAEKPYLYAKTLIGGILAAFCLFTLEFLRRLLKGFPLSLEKLKALRLPVLGSISSICDGPSVETVTGADLDLLRRLGSFIEKGQVIGLIAGTGPDYSYALGENLARMSTKSIVLRCDFLSKFRPSDAPGILQVWKGEISSLPIRKGKGFDYMTAGGFSPFGTEIIQSQNFSQIVDALKKNYDQVFLLFRGAISSAESTIALSLCDKAVVTVKNEQTEELTPFVNWAYHGDKYRLTFVASV